MLNLILQKDLQSIISYKLFSIFPIPLQYEWLPLSILITNKQKYAKTWLKRLSVVDTRVLLLRTSEWPQKFKGQVLVGLYRRYISIKYSSQNMIQM